MYSMSALGPALGFLIGAGFLSAYVEWSGAPKGMDESHAGWIGAWWAGFWLCSLFAFLSAVPLLFFPKRLPTSNCKAEKQESPSFIDFGDLKGKKPIYSESIYVMKSSSFPPILEPSLA